MSLRRIATVISGVFVGALAQGRAALAQNLPTPPAADGVNQDDFLAVLNALLEQGLTIFIFVIGAAAFILVGWSVVAKFNECRAGRAEWSEAAVTAGVGAVILVFATFLLTQAGDIFTAAA